MIPAAAALSLPAAAVVRTVLTPNKCSDYAAPEAGDYALELARKLSEMVRYETVSHANVAEVEKFLGFHKVLERLFPLVHEKLEKTVIDGNLLFKWKGTGDGMPILLMSHQDVVPAEGNGSTSRFPAISPTARSGGAELPTPRPRSWRFSRR